ncbi:sulfotransferase family 2 domain-containing protein [Maritimibacter sp. DP1N21-5]|uniref:sulfotransferase family 2 domain-containing protein n=1 Tax=Maritimibacter sp. DP1N21-5 TaxID=2836867 RepID=UPI00351CE2AF
MALEKLKIAYMPVPKAACSSVKAALAQVDPDVTYRWRRARRSQTYVHALYPTRRFRPHRWEKYAGGEWWRFTVVRDPLRRLLSVYSNRVRDFNELENSPRVREADALPVDPDPDFFFQNLQAYIDNSSVIKHHALPTYLFTGPAPLQFDRVYRVDELSAFAHDLADRTGQEVVLPKLNTSGERLTLDTLKPETVDALRDRLAPEYAELDGYFDNPFERQVYGAA